jgi:hypothetical protein
MTGKSCRRIETQNKQERVELTNGMALFVQRLTIHAFQSAHKQWNPPNLQLFAALVELEPSDETIRLVIECCHGDFSSDQSHSNYFVFNVLCGIFLELFRQCGIFF